MNLFQPWGLLVGRLMLAYMFIVSGYGKIAGFAGAAKFMASKGMPLVEPLLVGAIIIELIGGLMLVVGWKARWAAWAIFLFIIPTTIIFHPVWADASQMIQFNKNLAIMGGMLYIALMGPGRLSLDKS
ncbi:MAG: DoxX family protein [Burkholderiales bacterium]